MNQPILKIAVPSPLRQVFDYLPPISLPDISLTSDLIGSRALVQFGRGNREVIGFILEITDKSEVSFDKLKAVKMLLDPKPLLPASIIELIKWISDYYHHPIGEVFAKAFPSLLRHHKPHRKKIMGTDRDLSSYTVGTGHDLSNETAPSTKIPFHELNIEQQQAISIINDSSNFNTFLLDGVTGSGKTEVYLQIIEKTIAGGKQALVLVPEINLTPQTIARFNERFSINIAVLHSRLNDKEKLHYWLAAKEGSAPIIIGTRSAIFTPLKNPGIIILDEEHDLSFKQQSDLRYSARDVAIVRGKLENIPVILGSATPSLESTYNSKRKRYTRLVLSKRAGKAIHPDFHLVDMRSQKLKEGLTQKLIQAMQQHLERKNQVLVFLNRRGYAPVLLCHKCGQIIDCKNCDAHLTLHRTTQKLHCHYCNYSISIPNKCKNCGTENLLAIGMGTERIENSLKHLFPGVSVIRIDSDTTRSKGSIEKILDTIREGRNQILVGTKMLAKGHHFPNVTMVAILNTDNGLYSPDFRASEHLAQLIVQVAGRAGRAKHPGEVYIQTYHPRHPLLLCLANEGYHSFVNANLAERKGAQLPPFTYLALFRALTTNKEQAMQFLENLRKQGELLKNNKVKILGPIPSPMERKARRYQVQLLLQSKERQVLHKLLEQLIRYIDSLKLSRTLKWSLDVDPLEIFN